MGINFAARVGVKLKIQPINPEENLSIPANFENEIDAFVNQAMQAWNIPGLALAIVKDDQVMLAKGYGVRDMGKTNPVDEHSLFAIGSNTKAFTATAIGLLVQDGKLTWDDPVTKYLPTFQLYDSHTTHLLTIRDSLCHRSGLGTWAGDVLLLSSYPTEEVVRRLRHIPPDYGFRAGYGYSNLMFIAAGLIIETVSGMSWDDFIHRHIFAPLGMTDSVTNPCYFGKRTNIATPHEDVRAKLQTVIYREDAHVGAAGSICASVADIALWLRMQLNQGSLNGKQIVDAYILAETHTPHTPIKLTAIERKLFPSRHFSAYGLGWFLNDTYGHFIVRHTGGVDGMLSSTVFLPGERIGIAVFTNKLPNSAFVVVSHYLIEKLLGIPPQDWIQIYTDLEKEEQEKGEKARQQREAARAKDTRPSLALEKYAGAYDSPILGRATIRLPRSGNALQVQLQAHESISGRLEHWHYDTFLCHWNDPVLGESLIPFITDGQGQVAEFRVKIRPDWIDPLEHVFKKMN
jgi:CubicO group peptidase (beta-lactamase class C family)